MKKCTRCNNLFQENSFKIINSKTLKRSSKCDECIKDYNREYWERVKENKNPIKNEQTKRRRNIIRLFIINFLKSTSCKNCGIDDWRVLEFNHIDRNTKKFNIADGGKYSISTVKAEIEKCEVLCANCHNIHTIEQRGYYKYLDNENVL
jgi:hypothetical protein